METKKNFIRSGIGQFYVDKYDSMSILTEYFANDMGFIFRGQGDSIWKLQSSIERYLKDVSPDLRNASILNEQLLNFKSNLRGVRGAKLDLEENEIWAIGQHHGLYTPLLDWTYSFYVALFFAFYETNIPSSGYRAVYAIHRKSCEDEMVEFNKGLELDKKFQFVYPEFNGNLRAFHQEGLFTRLPFGFNIKNWFLRRFSGKTKDAHFFTIYISNNLRMRVLKELRQMNISPKSLFPDLEGYSMDCNLQLQLKSHKHLLSLLKIDKT